jgi:replicative DNA helicase
MSTPKNDLAEKALLASIFNNPEVIGDISELITPEDFFEPKHELIYQTIIALHQNGKDFSPVSVVGSLQKEGNLQQAGDIFYIRDIVNPTELAAMGADPIGFALLVKEASRLRELGRAGETILGASVFGTGLSADEALEVAEGTIVEIINKSSNSDSMQSVIDLLPEVIQDIRNAKDLPQGAITGIPSGFPDFDAMTGGFKGGAVVLIAARPGVGKLLVTMTNIPTPTGMKLLGDINAGDKVFGMDGKIYTVVKAHEILEGLETYEVVFSDGSKIIAGAEHLWYTETRAARKSRRAADLSTSTRETTYGQDILDTLKAELENSSAEDRMTLFDLAQVMGWASANSVMIGVASHLASVGQKLAIRSGVRQTKVVNSGKFFADVVANEKLIRIHDDSVILKKVTDLVHSSTDQQMSIAELSKTIFGEDSGMDEHRYISKVVRRSKTPTDMVERVVEATQKKPVLEYSKIELLEAWYKHANSPKNDQRHKAIAGSVKTTLEIKETLIAVGLDGRLNHSIPVAQPLVLPEAVLPIAPYALGTWLGDGFAGNGNICGEDPEIFDYIESLGYVPTSISREKAVYDNEFRGYNKNFRVVSFPTFTQALKKENLLLKNGESVGRNGSPKHIPMAYLRASIEQRREVLAGLMDTDGYAVRGSSLVQFFNSNKRLIDDTVELAASLGYRPVVAMKPLSERNPNHSDAYSVSWSTTDDVFKLSRKIAIHREGVANTYSDERNDQRYIVAVNKVDSVPMRCLTVDSPDSLFLVGDTLIATHNSTLAVDFGRSAAFLAGKTVLFFSLEMSAKELVNRILSAEARVEKMKLDKGDLDESDWMSVEEAKVKLANGTFLIDSNPKTSVSRIRSVASRQKLRPEGLDMIIVDYLQLMEAGAGGLKNASRENVVSEMSRGIKLLAKELDVPVILLSQLNRKSEERTDGRPLVSDLRESGSLEQDADMVLLIHRPESSDQNNRPGEADLIIGKHRGGPMGKIPLTSMLAYSKFVSGQGVLPREDEMLTDGVTGKFGTTDDEIPW